MILESKIDGLPDALARVVRGKVVLRIENQDDITRWIGTEEIMCVADEQGWGGEEETCEMSGETREDVVSLIEAMGDVPREM